MRWYDNERLSVRIYKFFVKILKNKFLRSSAFSFWNWSARGQQTIQQNIMNMEENVQMSCSNCMFYLLLILHKARNILLRGVSHLYWCFQLKPVDDENFYQTILFWCNDRFKITRISSFEMEIKIPKTWIVDKHMPIELYRNKLYNVWTYTASGTHSDTRVCVIQEIIKEIPRHYCYMRGWVQGIYADTANTHRIRSWPANRGKYDTSFMFSANYSTSYQLHIGRGFASRWVFTKRLYLLNQLRIKARKSSMIISM